MNIEETVKQAYPQSYESLSRYVDKLISDGIERGLMGPREADKMWDRHVLNSLALASLLPEGSTVVDVGSGAGLPGVPLAIVRPDLAMTLLEPLLRRSIFLQECVDSLGLEANTRVLRGRAEEQHDVYDAVVCRAVAPLPRLIEWCLSLFANDGAIYALKGSSADQEIADSSGILGKHGLRAEVRHIRAFPQAEATQAIVVTAR